MRLNTIIKYLLIVVLTCAGLRLLVPSPTLSYARPTLPTAIPASGNSPHAQTAILELQAEAAPGSAWAVVQWQSLSGEWVDVTGWQGPLDTTGANQWSVDAANFGQGPFRWQIYTQREGAIWGTSANFKLPAAGGEWLQVAVKAAIPPAAPAAPGSTVRGQILFAETFEPPVYYWGIGQGPFARIFEQGGALHLVVETAPRLVWQFASMPQTQDFDMVTTVKSDNCAGDDHAGVVFRAQDQVNLYVYGLTCDGRYLLWQKAHGQWQSLVHPTFTAASRVGAGASNQLGVRALGRRINLEINGQAVAQVEVAEATTGAYGIYAYAVVTSGLEAAFDDVLGWAAATP